MRESKFEKCIAILLLLLSRTGCRRRYRELPLPRHLLFIPDDYYNKHIFWCEQLCVLCPSVTSDYLKQTHSAGNCFTDPIWMQHKPWFTVCWQFSDQKHASIIQYVSVQYPIHSRSPVSTTMQHLTQHEVFSLFVLFAVSASSSSVLRQAVCKANRPGCLCRGRQLCFTSPLFYYWVGGQVESTMLT